MQIWGAEMGKPHPLELRERALRLVEQGNTHSAAARRLCVSIRFVNDMVRLKRETGSLAPKRQGNPGRGKLTAVKGWVERRIAARPDLAIDELTAELAAEHGVKVHRSSVGRLLLRLGLSHKKDLQALEQKRGDVADLRRIRIGKRQPFMARHLERLAFIDETSVKTNMAKTTGWAPRGQRLVDHAPFGHWRTQTFIGALRHDRLDAPWVIDGAMNSEMFALHVETQLVPTLRGGDVVILNNLSSHKSPAAAKALRDIGAWFLFLPPCSPDLNPIEMAFSKLKALIRKVAARTYNELWQAVGHVCDLFSDEECYNFFKAAGYRTD